MSAWVIQAKTESVSITLLDELLAKSNTIVPAEMLPTSAVEHFPRLAENSLIDEEETSTADDDSAPFGDWKTARRLTSQKRRGPGS